VLPIAWLCCAARCFAEDTAGVGLALREDGGRIVVNKVVADTPAAASGALHAGDRLLAIAEGDGKPVKLDGRKLHEAVVMLHGPEGSTVRLTVIPAGKTEADAKVVSIVRGVFKQLWGDGKLLAVGADAPDFTFTRIPGGEADKLSSYRGKTVVLAFWATWCGPCQDEIADLQAMVAKHPEWKEKVVVLTASVDEDREAVVKRLKEKGWDKTRTVWTDSKTLRAYHVDGIPTTYVIGPDGKVAAADPPDVQASVIQALPR
jgi:thiol-disulfide isomerase/thioredoxin